MFSLLGRSQTIGRPQVSKPLTTLRSAKGWVDGEYEVQESRMEESEDGETRSVGVRRWRLVETGRYPLLKISLSSADGVPADSHFTSLCFVCNLAWLDEVRPVLPPPEQGLSNPPLCLWELPLGGPRIPRVGVGGVEEPSLPLGVLLVLFVGGCEYELALRILPQLAQDLLLLGCRFGVGLDVYPRRDGPPDRYPRLLPRLGRGRSFGDAALGDMDVPRGGTSRRLYPRRVCAVLVTRLCHGFAVVYSQSDTSLPAGGDRNGRRRSAREICVVPEGWTMADSSVVSLAV